MDGDLVIKWSRKKITLQLPHKAASSKMPRAIMKDVVTVQRSPEEALESTSDKLMERVGEKEIQVELAGSLRFYCTA